MAMGKRKKQQPDWAEWEKVIRGVMTPTGGTGDVALEYDGQTWSVKVALMHRERPDPAADAKHRQGVTEALRAHGKPAGL